MQRSIMLRNGWAWNKIARRVMARDAHRCQLRLPMCLGIATEVDHIYPRMAGGGDELENLRAVCHPCHVGRGMGEVTQPPRRFSYGSRVITRLADE